MSTQIDIKSNRIDLWYSRVSVTQLQIRVVLAVMIDAGIKHTHVGRRAGGSEKEAFQHFMKEIYADFETLLVGVARNVRPPQQAAQASVPATAVSHTKTKTQAPPRPQTERVQTAPGGVLYTSPANAKKSPLATINLAGSQATVPASLTHMVRPTASMMDLLESRYNIPGNNSQSPYRMPHHSGSQQMLSSCRPASSMSFRPASIMRPQSPVMQRQSYMMSGALAADDWSMYGQDKTQYAPQHRLSRQASFMTAPTHFDASPSRPRLQSSASQSFMTMPTHIPAPTRPNLHHTQSLQFVAERPSTPARYARRLVTLLVIFKSCLG